MAQHQLRRLPVVDQGRIVGMVSQADVAKAAPPQDARHMLGEISKGEELEALRSPVRFVDAAEKEECGDDDSGRCDEVEQSLTHNGIFVPKARAA